MQQSELGLGPMAHDVGKPHPLEELATVTIVLEELLVAKHAIGELAARERAVTKRGLTREGPVERLELVLEERVGLGPAQQPAVEPQARVKVENLATQLGGLGRVLRHVRHVREFTRAGAKELAGAHLCGDV